VRGLAFTRAWSDPLRRTIAILILLAGGGCASPGVPVEPVRVQFLIGGDSVTALPIGPDRLLTVAHGVPEGEDSPARVLENGSLSMGTIRVLDRGLSAGDVPPREFDLNDAAGLAAMAGDWSVLWFEPGIAPGGPLQVVQPVVGDSVVIRGYTAAGGATLVTLIGKAERLVVGPNGPTVAFLVRPRGAVGPLAGMSGSPVYVVRYEGGAAHYLLAGICQGHLDTDGPSDGLIRCLPVPEEARVFIERSLEPRS